MATARMPKALVERPGNDGAHGLAAWLASTGAEWTEDVTAAIDRFERRLTIEIFAVRVDVAREISA